MNINKNYRDIRKIFMIMIVCLVFFIYTIQLLKLQIFNFNYKNKADNNAFLKQVQYSSRGLIFDREGVLIVRNQRINELQIIMNEINNLDTMAFCKALNISLEDCREKFRCIKNKSKNPGYSPYLPQIFLKYLKNEECNILQEFSYKFPGFYICKKNIRQYLYPSAAHVLGYTGLVSKRDIISDNFYQRGDYIGKTGIEYTYEKYLRSKKRCKILLRNASGHIEGKYTNELHESNPLNGTNLTISININLQAYGEELMRNKIGTIIMIEPKTGEILCMLSSPSFNLSDLIRVGDQKGKFYKYFISLVQNSYKPFFNRAINGIYPPGSVFKIAQSLVLLQEKIITSNTAYSCSKGWPVTGGHPLCHEHKSPLSLALAIELSCNSYFCWGLKNMIENKKYISCQNAINKWRNLMVSQGLGYPLGVDLPGEKGGTIPNSQHYNRLYKKYWNVFSIISIAIGQGEITLSPCQMCNLAATIANRGYFYTPHIIKNLSKFQLNTLYLRPHYTGIKSQYYLPIIEGMRLAVTSGTCNLVNIPDIPVCGKTGTAQNNKEDHSIFIGFAPMYNPKVAILVFVENGGFGSSCAVSISRLMLQKYFKDTIPKSDKWIEKYIKKMGISKHVVHKK